jgi:hypothetical protein
MDRVLIHIGYHKTASTWLQNELFVSGNAVFEPLSKKSRNPSTLAINFIIGADKYLLPSFEMNKSIIQKELNEIMCLKPELGEKIAVMSHERLSGNPHSSGFDSQIIARRIAAIFPSANIFIMIREQRSFILSNYFQYLSKGGVRSLNQYLDTKYDGKRPGFSPHHVDYLPLIKAYMELFGEANVKVLTYEMFKYEPKRFIGELGGFLGAELKMDERVFNKKIHHRENYYTTFKLRALNKFLGSSSLNDYSTWSNGIMATMARSAKKGMAIITPLSANEKLLADMGQEVSEWVGSRYMVSNAELSKLLGLDLAKYGYACK